MKSGKHRGLKILWAVMSLWFESHPGYDIRGYDVMDNILDSGSSDFRFES